MIMMEGIIAIIRFVVFDSPSLIVPNDQYYVKGLFVEEFATNRVSFSIDLGNEFNTEITSVLDVVNLDRLGRGQLAAGVLEFRLVAGALGFGCPAFELRIQDLRIGLFKILRGYTPSNPDYPLS